MVDPRIGGRFQASKSTPARAMDFHAPRRLK